MRTLTAVLLALACLSARRKPPIRSAARSKRGFRRRAPARATGGFIEVCGQDAALCKSVAAGYPPPTPVWSATSCRPKSGSSIAPSQRTDFSRYLVALIAESTEPAQFSELRAFVRARRGGAALDPKAPDRLRCRRPIRHPRLRGCRRRDRIGRHHQAPSGRPAKDTVLASTNIAYLAKDRVLSLYTYADVTDPAERRPRDAARARLAEVSAEREATHACRFETHTSEAADAAAIAEIYNHYIEHTVVTFEETLVSAADFVARIEVVHATGFPWLVAEEAGRVLGYAYATKWKERSAYRFSAEVTVYLAPTATGRGLGTRLYTELFPMLDARGLHALMGGITLPNEASVALHEKFGMRKVAHFEEVGFKFGRWLAVGYWQRTA